MSDRMHFELEHRETQLALGAYVLGALDDAEAERVERHLAECGHCAGDVEDLKPSIDVLSQSVPEVQPEPALRERVMRAVQADAEIRRATSARRQPREARRPRWLARPALAGGLAALVLAAGAGAGFGIWGATHDSVPPTRTIAAQVAPQAGEHARASLELRGARSVLHVKGMEQPAPGRVYQVWLQRGSNPPQPTDALFTPRSGGSASVVVPGDVRHADRVMVTEEASGGATVPTPPVLIRVGLA